jgi:hypothetical protein
MLTVNIRPHVRPTIWRRLWEQLFVSHTKRKPSMVMNIRFGSQINQEPRAPLELIIQNNPQPPPPDGD